MDTIIITLNFLLAKDAKLKKGNEFAQVTCQERRELKAQRVWTQNLCCDPQIAVQ